MDSLVGELPENHGLDLQMCSASCFLLSSSTSSTLPPLWKNHHIFSQNFDHSHRLPPPPAAAEADRREHMFDKVVTPSDVGKLNRLVIPKQHAEKYFPLDAAASGSSGGGGGKGLVLNFEDRNGRSWRFRYSYWNSSQSYVMTKGWSRFVKDKRLDAGDIVSFHRGTGGFSKNRLYIDWKHRWNNHPSAAAGHFSRSLLPAAPQFYHPYSSGYGFGSGNLVNYKNPVGKMVIESIPVVQEAPAVGAGKKLRLFGVNMECLDASDSDITQEANADTASFHSLQLRLYNGTPVPNKTKGKVNSNSSLSLDFTM